MRYVDIYQNFSENILPTKEKHIARNSSMGLTLGMQNDQGKFKVGNTNFFFLKGKGLMVGNTN